MALSKDARKALEDELAAITDERTRLQRRLEYLEKREHALTVILSDEGGPNVDLPDSNGFTDLGLRDAIRHVLREAGALKPRKVTRIMRSRGYEVDGKTKLGTRVGNELWKMSESGSVSKNDSGEYFIPGS